MKIILIGANGKIGELVQKALAGAGHEIVKVGHKSGDFSEESDNLVRGDLAEVVYHRVCPVPTQTSIFVAAPSTSANQPRRPAITPAIASSAIPALGDRQSTLAGRWHCRKILGSATQQVKMFAHDAGKPKLKYGVPGKMPKAA